MRAALERIRQAALADLERCESPEALEDARVRILGRKGELTAVLRGMREIAEGDSVVDEKALDLMKDRRVRHVVVAVAIGGSRCDHPQRGLTRLHHPDLHG